MTRRPIHGGSSAKRPSASPLGGAAELPPATDREALARPLLTEHRPRWKSGPPAELPAAAVNVPGLIARATA